MNNRRPNIRQGFRGNYFGAAGDRDVNNGSGVTSPSTVPSHTEHRHSSEVQSPPPVTSPGINSVPNQRTVRVVNVSIASPESRNNTGAAETRPQPDTSMIENTKVSMEPPWAKPHLNSPPQRKPFTRTFGLVNSLQQTSPKASRAQSFRQEQQEISPKQPAAVIVEHVTNESADPPPRSESPSVKMVVASFENAETPDRPTPTEKPAPRTRMKVSVMKESLLRQSADDTADDDDHKMLNLSQKFGGQLITGPQVDTIAMPQGSSSTQPSQHELSPSPPTPPPKTIVYPQNNSCDHSAISASSSNLTSNRQQSNKARSPQSNSAKPKTSKSKSSPAQPRKRSKSPVAQEPTNNHVHMPVSHVRQKSQEEMVCDEQAAKVAQNLEHGDSQLSAVLLPPPEHKTTTDYMSGIFDTKVDVTRRPSLLLKDGQMRPVVTRRDGIRQQLGSRYA